MEQPTDAHPLWRCAYPTPSPDCCPANPCGEFCAYVPADRDRGDAPNAPAWVQSVLPSDIVRQRSLGWPDFHPEDFCHICGRRNPVWSAPAADWDEVIDGHGGIFCPSCWATLYEATTGKSALWWFATFDPAESNPLQHLLDKANAEIVRLSADRGDLEELRAALAAADALTPGEVAAHHEHPHAPVVAAARRLASPTTGDRCTNCGCSLTTWTHTAETLGRCYLTPPTPPTTGEPESGGDA